MRLYDEGWGGGVTCTLGLLLIKACLLLSAGFCSRFGREVSAVSECRTCQYSY